MLTTGNLRRGSRKIIVNACILCLNNEKLWSIYLSIIPLLLVWQQVPSLVQVFSLMMGWLKNHFQSCCFGCRYRKGIVLQGIAFVATVWSLWLGMNGKILKDKLWSGEDIIQVVKWVSRFKWFSGATAETIIRFWTEVFKNVPSHPGWFLDGNLPHLFSLNLTSLAVH